DDMLLNLVNIADLLVTHSNFYSDGSLSFNTSFNLKMGFGWNCYDTNFNLITSFNASTQYWPSSTRAELSALLSIIMVVPINSSVHVYTDSQTLIQGFDNIKQSNNASRRQYLKKQNYVMWSCIENIYKSHNLSITLYKVQKQAEDLYNKITDAVAKHESTSDII